MRHRRHLIRCTAAVVIFAAAIVTDTPASFAQTSVPPGPQTPLPNPTISDSCGTNVTLVLDASGSINSSNAVGDVRDAGEAFLDALADTGSTARVLQFASVSEELAAQAEVTAASLAPGGSFRDAIRAYYNPTPPRPASVSIYRYDGRGDPQSRNNWDPSTRAVYTNWDQSLDQAGEPQARPTELILYVTDGDPTAYDFNQSGDPFDDGPPPDVGIRTDRDDAKATTLDRAIEEANQAKSAGARILAVGVGAAVTGSPSSRQRLIDIAGPQTATDGDLDSIDSINEIDVALVRDFDKLGSFLRSVVSELCSPSLSIRKLAQTEDSSAFTPAAGWNITAAPSVTGGTYEWILPDTDAAQAARCTPVPTDPDDQATRTCATDAAGLVTFQWEPNPGDAATRATVSETVQPGFTPGRAGVDDDWTCTLKNIDGSQVVEEGDFTTLSPPTFELDVDPEQIITCSIYNRFGYAPAIAVTKANSPVVVRGDLSPTYGPGPAEVTSTFEVTNPGNASLRSVDVDDDQCAPVVSVDKANGNNVGDLDDDGLLDPATAESWQFTCTRTITRGLTQSPINIINRAVATGTDPEGTSVTSTQVQDDVDVIVPAIMIDKQVSSGALGPADSLTIVRPTPTTLVPATYTYEVTADGNTALSITAPTDDQCAPVDAVLAGANNVGDTDTDGLLDVGEAWQYTCDASLTDTTTNVATVSGTPAPETLPTPAVNPPVTATDTATVTVLDSGIRLDKSVDQTVVFPGTTANYSYVVTNTGTVGLVPDGLNPPVGGDTPGTAGLTITDDQCSPVTFVSVAVGNADAVLDPNESWNYSCSATINVNTLNVATVVGQPLGTPDDLADSDTALVEVRTGEIAVDKTALRPVVLDPDATPVDGPDVPTPRLAAYEYAVSNPGSLPLDLTDGVTTALRVTDDVCSPVVPTEAGGFNVGDANEDGLLDITEIWQFTCSQQLDKDDGVVPPGPNPQPSLVKNTVTAVGTPLLAPERGPDVTATDTADVLVIEPSLTIDKTPCLDVALTNCVDDPLVRPGTAITYRYVVTNTGDSGLVVVGLVDDRCDTVEFVGGDDNGNDILDGGATPEAWTLRCTTSVNFPSPVVNTAAVVAVGALENVYTDTDTAQVRVFDPAIDLVKSVSSNFVPTGSTVTYTFDVTNAGDPGTGGLPADVILSDIVLADVSSPENPTCLFPTFVGGDDNGNDLLEADPAETWTYTCTGVIDEQTVNVAGVRGDDILGAPVFDADIALVTPYEAGIDIVKSAAPTTLPVGGGPVTYTYEVVNTGDVPLADVNTRVTDDRCAPVTPVLSGGFNVGDVDQNDLLTSDDDLFETGGPETWLFECTTTLTETTLNTVTTIGTPVRPDPVGPETLGPDVIARDTANVVVAEPGSITIIKEAVPASGQLFGFGGDLGAFTLAGDGTTASRRTFEGLAPGTYRVSENPTASWELVSITCVDPTNDSSVSGSIATVQLGSGESVTCTYTNQRVGDLPATGGNGPQPILLIGLAALFVGAVMWWSARGRFRGALLGGTSNVGRVGRGVGGA